MLAEQAYNRLREKYNLDNLSDSEEFERFGIDYWKSIENIAIETKNMGFEMEDSSKENRKFFDLVSKHLNKEQRMGLMKFIDWGQVDRDLKFLKGYFQATEDQNYKEN